jgi:hypothetical protein
VSDLSRRDAIKIIGAAAGAVGISALPDAWEKPVVEAANLSVAAAASPVPTATLVPTATAAPTRTAAPTATATPSPTPSPVPMPPVVAITFPTEGAYYQGYGSMTFTGTSTIGSTVTLILDGVNLGPAYSDASTGDWNYPTEIYHQISNSTYRVLEARAEKGGLFSSWATVNFAHFDTAAQ